MPQCPLHTCEILANVKTRKDSLNTGAESLAESLDKRVLDWLIADCRQLHAIHKLLVAYRVGTINPEMLAGGLLNIADAEKRNPTTGHVCHGSAHLNPNYRTGGGMRSPDEDE